MGKTVHNKVFKSTSHERGYKASCLSSFSPDTTFCFCFGQVYKNISDSENVKSVVKFHSFKTTVLTVQKLIEIDRLWLISYCMFCFVLLFKSITMKF